MKAPLVVLSEAFSLQYRKGPEGAHTDQQPSGARGQAGDDTQARPHTSHHGYVGRLWGEMAPLFLTSSALSPSFPWQSRFGSSGDPGARSRSLALSRTLSRTLPPNPRGPLAVFRARFREAPSTQPRAVRRPMAALRAWQDGAARSRHRTPPCLSLGPGCLRWKINRPCSGGWTFAGGTACVHKDLLQLCALGPQAPPCVPSALSGSAATSSLRAAAEKRRQQEQRSTRAHTSGSRPPARPGPLRRSVMETDRPHPENRGTRVHEKSAISTAVRLNPDQRGTVHPAFIWVPGSSQINTICGFQKASIHEGC